MKMRVWWVSNPPREGFRVEVDSPEKAVEVINLLAEYDLYLDAYIDSNAQGLEVFEDGEWVEWYSEDGEDIDEWAHNHS